MTNGENINVGQTLHSIGEETADVMNNLASDVRVTVDQQSGGFAQR